MLALRRQLSLVCLVCALVVHHSAAFAQEEAAAPSAAAIQRAIKNLGHDDYPVREAASKELWSWGTTVEAALQQAALSTDAEIRLRAKTILEKFELGITPDSPPEYEMLITAFRQNTIDEKQTTLHQLINEKKIKLAFKLARAESDPSQRDSLLSSASRQAQRYVPDLLVNDEIDEAESILESIEMTLDPSLERLTAMLLVSGRLPDRLKRAEEQLARAPSFATAKRLVYLRRASGDLVGAADLAGKHQLHYYQRAILIENNDWKGAAALQQEMFKVPNLAAETLAFGAALHFFAGDEPAVEFRLQTLREIAPEQLSKHWDAAEAHLVCERHEQALQLLATCTPGAASLLHELRFDYARSQQLAGVTKESVLDDAWFGNLVDGGLVATQKTLPRGEFARNIAKQLHYLGERERARQVLAVMRKAAELDKSGQLWPVVIQTSIYCGDRQQALADLNVALGRPNITPSAMFRAMYDQPQDAVLAELLYARLGTEDEQRRLSLATMDQVFGPIGMPDEMRGPINAQIVETIEPFMGTPDHRQLKLGELMLKLGDRQQARRWFEAASSSYSDALVRLGDLAREERDWPVAIKHYRAAADKLPVLPLPRFLLSYSLLQNGETDEAKQQQRRASLAALSPVGRLALAGQLKERGLFAEATEQARIVELTANPTVQYPTLAAGHLRGNLVFQQSPAVAAEVWQRWLLSQLVGVNNYTQFDHYLTDPEVIHRNRGRALLAAGKTDLALAEVKRVLAIIPGNVRVLEEFVPLLERAGREKEASELLESVARRYEQVIRDYPQTSNHRRELALLFARCNRRRDEALALAQAAVKLEEQTALNHDALAEIHFLRGEQGAAISAGQRAAAIERNNPKYRERLAQWEKGPAK
ncbi:Tetratricopeptide repeat protein [Anatilimnocola aggregata]|uniref:Tetratricopeptide repeat protein n=1 Tax=Anatilimnocola aggregata TaxID=2528021 RepID=A0A517Y632_9BACT|nr:hypothetical protein [Anatilimnocola aggregata]QDU25699.1 Tetratricopeptide repeat protein [Anatilimnocola aggregata]